MTTVCMLLLDLLWMHWWYGNMLVLFFVLSSFGRPHSPYRTMDRHNRTDVCAYVCVCAHVAWVCEHSKTSYLIKWTWIANCVFHHENHVFMSVKSIFTRQSCCDVPIFLYVFIILHAYGQLYEQKSLKDEICITNQIQVATVYIDCCYSYIIN